MTHIKWPNELGPPVPHEPNWQNEAMRQSALLHSAMLGGARAEAKLAKAVEALKGVVPYWDKANPLRLADHHHEGHDCDRCKFDHARTVLAELEKTE